VSFPNAAEIGGKSNFSRSMPGLGPPKTSRKRATVSTRERPFPETWVHEEDETGKADHLPLKRVASTRGQETTTTRSIGLPTPPETG
jgi:hypothetical protein